MQSVINIGKQRISWFFHIDADHIFQKDVFIIRNIIHIVSSDTILNIIPITVKLPHHAII